MEVNVISNLFDWIKKISISRVKSEVKWLHEMREAAESWYNELALPLMPVLTREIDISNDQVREKYAGVARKLDKQEILVNNGNKLQNLLTEMGPRGIPFVTNRKELNELAESFLNGGFFIKTIMADLSEKDPSDYRHAQESAIADWNIFREKKDSLVQHINELIGKIGIAK